MFSVTTPTQIRNAPLNNSSAKVQWSFGKASRFPNSKSNSKQLGYDAKSTLSARRTSIGYGNRSTFLDARKDTIDPGSYNLSTSFIENSNKKKGYNFGYNRDQLNFSNYLKFSQRTPGPAKYQIDEHQIVGEKAYSMRPKTAYPKNYFLNSNPENERKSKEPGPGKYQTIDCIGSKYHLSKSMNMGNTSFLGNKRFNKIKRTPGPGDYTINIEDKGHTFLSTLRQSGRVTKLSQKRQLKLVGNRYTPGPGTYRQPSDFGHYQGNIRPHTARR